MHFRYGAAAALALGIGLVAAPAQAHFILQAPESWMTQDSNGLPEKLGPCGDEYDDAGGMPTGVVTAFQSGQTITVTVNEVIFHPGHYRIALAVDNRSELPAEPAVTAGVMPCGTAAIESPPVFPVLADDVFDHTAQFTSPQSVQLTLPANVTCTKCTLQVIEFMSDHDLNMPGGCFYHHCADISLSSADGAAPSTSGTSAAASNGGSSEEGTSSGHASSGGSSEAAASGGSTNAGPAAGSTQGSKASGGCSMARGTAPSIFGLAAIVGFASLARRRRKRKDS